MIWLSLLIACGPGPLPAGGAAPDILLISMDTLRVDHLSVYGYSRDTTPHLDALARRGLRFLQARSPSPWTLPSHTTMLTGLLPQQHLVTEDHLRLDPQVPLLQERLAAQGYATGGFVTSLYVSSRFGFDRGFDLFDDFEIQNIRENLKDKPEAEDVVDKALAFTRSRPGEPVFLFLHLYDAHYPYNPPPPWNTVYDRAPQEGDARYKSYEEHMGKPLEPEQLEHQLAQYDEEIHYADAQIGRLLAAFAEAGREPIVVLTADHGEEFFERGSWGHAHTLYPEQLHIPMILAGPGVPQGETPERVVGLQDLAPTLAALGGAEMPGLSLLEDSAEPRLMLCDTSRFDTNLLGLWLDGQRLDWDLNTGRVALYADTLEQSDIATQEPERLARLESITVTALGQPWTAEPGVISSEGAIMTNGHFMGNTLSTTQPLSFAVVPPDSLVWHSAGVQARAAGGDPPPAEGPLRYQGQRAGGVTLSDAERRRLEALGYIQER